MKIIDHDSQPLEEWRAGVTTRMRVSALTGAAELNVFEQWCAPGMGAPTHWHEVEEVLTVLSGKAEVWVGDARATLTAGQSALAPARQRHGFRNAGEGELHMLAILAAAVFEAYYEGGAGVTRRWDPAAG